MIRTDRLLPRLVLMGALAAALAVGGCGRKGPLDAPPGGAAELKGDQASQAPTSGGAVSRGGAGSLPRVQGQDKRIPLDALLN